MPNWDEKNVPFKTMKPTIEQIAEKWGHIMSAALFDHPIEFKEFILEAITEATKQLQKEKDEFRLALESLTPQGSEFVNDSKRCVDYIRDVRTSRHNAILSATKRAIAAEQQLEQAQSELTSLRQDKAMLDWLEIATNQNYIFGYFVKGGSPHALRQAITAAMKETK